MRIMQNIKPLFSIIILLNACSSLPAFSNKTHKAISEKALTCSQTDAYLKNQLSFSQGLGAMLLLDQSVVSPSEKIPTAQFETRITPELPSNPCSILNFFKAGANLEDVPTPRARHHFHDPIRNAGLDNKTDYPDWAKKINTATLILYRLHFDLTGASSEKRALGIEEAMWETEYQNYYAWLDARTYLYRALTKTNLAERNHYLALTFISLGQTVHLLEDLGVPAHARNDFVYGHMKSTETSWGNPFEGWAEKQVTINNGNMPSSWLTGWMPQPKAFDKISKYWDTDSYAGNYVGADPCAIWGLAERTNYQFLSTSTSFGSAGTLYQFPHPAQSHTTIISELRSGGEERYRYFEGYGVGHLARESYTHYFASEHGLNEDSIDSTITSDDNSVYEDYAGITIPRTIDYASGLLNYFFRGRLKVEPNWTDSNFPIFVITNDSNNSGIPQTLNGGSFELYYDTQDGNRTQITDFTITGGWNSGSTLAYDANIILTFTKPAATAAKYIAVYKGNICQNSDAPDPCDANAIAVCVLSPGYEIVAWGNNDYNQISDAPAGADFIAVAAGRRHGLALKSDGSIKAWGFNLYGQCNIPPDGNIFYTAIAAGSRHSLALKSDGSIVVWGDNSLNQISNKPDGNDWTAIAAGEYHSLALKKDGSIVGWGGYNNFGECDASPADESTVYVGISAGFYHSMALQSDGIPKAWGSNNQGQTRFYSNISGIKQVAACNYNSMILRDDQWITTWGNGDWVTPDVLPRYHHRPADGNDFVTVVAGWDHILALTSNGKIFAWDWPMGDFPFENFRRNDVPADIVFAVGPADFPQATISVGYDFSLALKAQ